MRREAEALAHELAELVRVRDAIAAERDAHAASIKAQAEERRRLELLIAERQEKLAETEQALAEQRRGASTLAQRAANLRDLIVTLEQHLDAAARAAREAARATTGRDRVDSPPELAALHDPGRLTPAVAFSSARGLLPLPVNGVRMREFGAPDGLGGTELGLSMTTRPGAQVTAPCDGWVVYSGPFRNYGQLLILNAGGGYHVVLAGMEEISVDLGQFVLTGEPVAVMGGGARAAAIANGASQPLLYVEFRKDGVPIDSGPWWASQEGEKVRG
jgi:septal ring factor EnvC (AmiA/AmiB activator)